MAFKKAVVFGGLVELVGIKRQNLFLLFICNVVLRIQIHEHTMYTLLAINTIINAPLPHHHVDEVQYQRKNNQLLFSSIIYTLRKLLMTFELY